jgi:hypothetical protein
MAGSSIEITKFEAQTLMPMITLGEGTIGLAQIIIRNLAFDYQQSTNITGTPPAGRAAGFYEWPKENWLTYDMRDGRVWYQLSPFPTASEIRVDPEWEPETHFYFDIQTHEFGLNQTWKCVESEGSDVL